MPIRKAHWETRFGRWVKRRGGLSQVVKDLSGEGLPVTRQAVFNWMSGARYPRRPYQRALARLSGGALRPSDFDPPVSTPRDTSLDPTRGSPCK